MIAGLPLMRNILYPSAKNVFFPLELSTAMSATDATIQKKIPRSGNTALIISNEEMENLSKIVKSLEESGLLIKRISKTIKNETKEQKWGFLSMLLVILAATILGNALAGKVVLRASKGVIIVVQNF